MAKKKKRNKKKNTATKKDLTIVILIILSILLGVLIYAKSGFIGIKLNEILGGVFGIIEYVLPVGIFALGIKLACDDKEEFSAKLLQYIIFIISLCIAISVIQLSDGELHANKEVQEAVKDAYILGMQNKGGGALRCSRRSPTC